MDKGKSGSLPLLIAVGGLSFSGKSTLGLAIAKTLDAEVIRSDAIRKSIVGVRPTERAPRSAYAPEISLQVYDELIKRGCVIAKAGRRAILDATFLRPEQRQAVELTASLNSITFKGLWCYVDEEVARRRATLRTGDISDADIYEYERQRTRDIGSLTWCEICTDVEIDTLVNQAMRMLAVN